MARSALGLGWCRTLLRRAGATRRPGQSPRGPSAHPFDEEALLEHAVLHAASRGPPGALSPRRTLLRLRSAAQEAPRPAGCRLPGRGPEPRRREEVRPRWDVRAPAAPGVQVSPQGAESADWRAAGSLTRPALRRARAPGLLTFPVWAHLPSPRALPRCPPGTQCATLSPSRGMKRD